MASRGKHLLEAFRVAGPNAPAPPHATPSGGPPGASSGASSPLAPGAPKSSAVPSIGSLARPSSGPTVIALNAAQLRLFGLVVLLLTVVAFLFGRMSVSRVAEAAEDGAAQDAAAQLSAGQLSAGQLSPGQLSPAEVERAASESLAQQAPAASPVPVAAPSAPAAASNTGYDPNPRTPAEQALLDRANVYTIKLVHYTNTEVNKRLAANTARYVIEQQNLPAVVAADNTGLYILVGAAPRQVDLDGFLARVKKMPGPPPQSRPAEFHSAYVEKIDRVFRREK
jgi:hypothetical protein